MGEASRRKRQAQCLDVQVVSRVGTALRKLAGAASSHLGSDCYLHAVLGQKLLEEQGISARIAAGEAAWRTGNSDGSVISHTSREKGYLPPGTMGFAYHAWLMVGSSLLDFTTYLLKDKGRELDSLDGGHTEVDWCPDFLLVDVQTISSYQKVAQGHTGLYYYERNPAIETRLANGFELDPEDLAIARLIYSSPDLVVRGPNHLL